MNILPKSSKEFARKEYWDQFFTKRSKSFEWYGEYSDLKGVLLKYLKATDNLLIVGCGNSSLSADLFDDGYHQNTSIDISEVAIKKMISKYKCNNRRQEMTFEVMDIFNMNYEDEQFNTVIDKGTLDALSSDNLDLPKMFDEIGRVLKPLGRYICVTLLQENVLRRFLAHFTQSGTWIVRIHRCRVTSTEATSDSVNLPVFVVVCTKLKSSLPVASLIDIDIHGNGSSFHKCPNSEQVLSIIDSAQKFEFLKYHVRNNKIEDDNFHIELFGDQASTDSRYRLYFVQKATISSARCAVFIVPQGREHEWLFSTNKGRENLLKQCQVERLIVVHLSRSHAYEGMEKIKEELGGQVPQFFPSDAKKINFLSIGEDIGDRSLLYQGKSAFCGQFIVEDVSVNSEKFRRLVFLGNRNVIQSEVRLKSVKSKKSKKPIDVIDNSFLSCDHHKTIAASLCLLAHKPAEIQCSLLLVGLGGGCFVNFLAHNLPANLHLAITVIEIDKAMLDIAHKWFDFQKNLRKSDNNMSIEVVIEDGLTFINESSKKFDFIIFDVDSKDLDLGVSCPPKEFVEELFLRKVASCLTEQGFFILNLVARNEGAKKDIYQRLRSLFSQCLLSPIENDLNEILVCTNWPNFNWPKLKGAQERHSQLRQSPLYMDILGETYCELAQMKPSLL